MLRQHQTWHQTSEFQHGFSWANDSGPERTFPWVNMLNYLFCAPWPCGQTESVWNQVVMTGWGDQNMHTHTNPVAQWWRIEWEISQTGKALDGSAHLFHLLAPLSGLWNRLPVTEHHPVTNSTIQSVLFIPVTTHACSIFKCTSASS